MTKTRASVKFREIRDFPLISTHLVTYMKVFGLLPVRFYVVQTLSFAVALRSTLQRIVIGEYYLLPTWLTFVKFP